MRKRGEKERREREGGREGERDRDRDRESRDKMVAPGETSGSDKNGNRQEHP